MQMPLFPNPPQPKVEVKIGESIRLSKSLSDIIKETVLSSFFSHDRNAALTGRALGIPKSTLHDWLRTWGISTKRARSIQRDQHLATHHHQKLTQESQENQ